MINIKKIMSAALIGIMSLSIAGCTLIEKTPEAKKNTVLAKVGKENITRGKLDEFMEDMIEQLKAEYGEDYTKNTEAMNIYKTQGKNALNNLVLEELLYQKAQEYNLVPDTNKMDEELAKELETIKKNYFQNDQNKFETELVNYGLTMDTLKDQLKEQLTSSPKSVAANRVYEYIIKDEKIEDSEVSAYYEANKDSFVKEPGARLAHILVDSEEKAKEIKTKLNNGAKFEDLAKEYGTDGTKDNGGDLGWYAYDSQELVQEFMDGAKTLEEGQISDPVKTQFGYHIIKATEVNKESVTQTLDEVKEQIRAILLQQKQQDKFTTTMESWKKELKVKLYEDRI